MVSILPFKLTVKSCSRPALAIQWQSYNFQYYKHNCFKGCLSHALLLELLHQKKRILILCNNQLIYTPTEISFFVEFRWIWTQTYKLDSYQRNYDVEMDVTQLQLAAVRCIRTTSWIVWHCVHLCICIFVSAGRWRGHEPLQMKYWLAPQQTDFRRWYLWPWRLQRLKIRLWPKSENRFSFNTSFLWMIFDTFHGMDLFL